MRSFDLNTLLLRQFDCASDSGQPSIDSNHLERFILKIIFIGVVGAGFF